MTKKTNKVIAKKVAPATLPIRPKATDLLNLLVLPCIFLGLKFFISTSIYSGYKNTCSTGQLGLI